jgi:hypothetical protein
MSIPNFMVIGVQKAGTTYLCKALLTHPDIFIPPSKELFFFTKKGVTKQDYVEYLENHFKCTHGKKYVGEGSTTYFQWPYALSNIASFIGSNIKFIVCLRQPTEKAVSFYIHNWRRERYKLGVSILKVGQQDARLSPTESSKYADSLRRWLEIYNRDQLKILLFDLLQKDPIAFVQEATDYLGVSPVEKVKKEAVNVGLPLVWDGEDLTIAPSKVIPGQIYPRFPKKELQILHSRFLQDIDETSELLDIDLSSWKEFPQFAPGS